MTIVPFFLWMAVLFFPNVISSNSHENKNIALINEKEKCKLGEYFFEKSDTWAKTCPMLMKMLGNEEMPEINENALESEEKVEFLWNTVEKNVFGQIDLIDWSDGRKMNWRQAPMRFWKKKKINFDANGIHMTKSSSSGKFDESGIARRKLLEGFRCKGWDDLKNQYKAYWRLAMEIWKEYRHGGNNHNLDIKQFEKFRKEGIKFFNHICERDYVPKEKCEQIDANSAALAKPEDWKEALKVLGKFVLKTLVAKKVYSPEDISDRTLAWIKAILTRKDFLHKNMPNLLAEQQSDSKKLIRRKKREFFTVLAAGLGVTLVVMKIILIVLFCILALLGAIMTAGYIKWCLTG